MLLNCPDCGHSWSISKKKHSSKRNIKKSMNMNICSNCGKKVFYSFISKYDSQIRQTSLDNYE